MPCHFCQKLQSDPVKGSAPWARGVIEREQVLICPDCQSRDRAWAGRMDRCQECSGTRLSIVLGSIVCRQCGAQSG